MVTVKNIAINKNYSYRKGIYYKKIFTIKSLILKSLLEFNKVCYRRNI